MMTGNPVLTKNCSEAPLTSIVFFFPTMKVNNAPKQPGFKLSSKHHFYNLKVGE